jgi:hypothetical protein
MPTCKTKFGKERYSENKNHLHSQTKLFIAMQGNNKERYAVQSQRKIKWILLAAWRVAISTINFVGTQ